MSRDKSDDTQAAPQTESVDKAKVETQAEDKSAAKKGLSMVSLVADMGAHKASNEADLKELRDAMGAMGEAVKGMHATLASLNERFGKLEVSAPPVLRALDLPSVKRIISTEPYARFEVLVTWKHASSYLPAGREIRADHYPMLLDYVRAGLKLGMPQDQEAAIDQYRAQAQGRADAYRHEALARAQSDVDAAQLKADALTGD